MAVPSDPVRMVDLDSQVAHVREVGRLFRGPCSGTAAANQKAEKAGGGGLASVSLDPTLSCVIPHTIKLGPAKRWPAPTKC